MNFEEHQEQDQEQPIESRVHYRKKRRKGIRRIVLLSVALIFGLVIYNAVAMMKFLDVANKNEFSTIGNDVKAVEWDGDERVNILLLGVDNREKDMTPRSDTMIVLSVDPETHQGNLMSIMRDTYVTIPGHGEAKINRAFAIGGPELAMKTVENFLKIPVHYYVVTDFQGFEGIINAIGGVDIDVEIPMNHADDGVYDINLQKGMQHLDGKKALQYVRYRGDVRADFARTERQRKLIKAVVQKMKSPLILVRFPSMLKAAESYVQTNMKSSDLLRMSTDFLKVSSSNLSSAQIPPDDLLTETYNYIGESILQPDTKGVQKFVKDLLEQDPDVAAEKPGTGQVSGTSGGTAIPTAPTAKPGTGTSASGSHSGRTGKVISDQGANVRQGPGTNHTALRVANTGDLVTILGEEGDWYKVQLADGTEGYIYKPLVSAE